MEPLTVVRLAIPMCELTLGENERRCSGLFVPIRCILKSPTDVCVIAALACYMERSVARYVTAVTKRGDLRQITDLGAKT